MLEKNDALIRLTIFINRGNDHCRRVSQFRFAGLLQPAFKSTSGSAGRSRRRKPPLVYSRRRCAICCSSSLSDMALAESEIGWRYCARPFKNLNASDFEADNCSAQCGHACRRWRCRLSTRRRRSRLSSAHRRPTFPASASTTYCHKQSWLPDAGCSASPSAVFITTIFQRIGLHTLNELVIDAASGHKKRYSNEKKFFMGRFRRLSRSGGPNRPPVFPYFTGYASR